MGGFVCKGPSRYRRQVDTDDKLPHRNSPSRVCVCVCVRVCVCVCGWVRGGGGERGTQAYSRPRNSTRIRHRGTPTPIMTSSTTPHVFRPSGTNSNTRPTTMSGTAPKRALRKSSDAQRPSRSSSVRRSTRKINFAGGARSQLVSFCAWWRNWRKRNLRPIIARRQACDEHLAKMFDSEQNE